MPVSVPATGPWHLVHVKQDGLNGCDGDWCCSIRPNILLSGYLLVITSDPDRYERAKQNCRELVAKKRRLAPLN